MREKNTVDFSSAISKALTDEFEARRDKDYKYNQRNFADDLDINYDSLVRYMIGERTPSLENLGKIRQALDCSFDKLLSQKKEYIYSDEDRLIDEISQYTGLDKKTIYNLHTYIDDELIRVINLLLNSEEYSSLLLNALYDYFTFSTKNGAFVMSSLDARESIDNTMQIDGIADDFYDGFDGKMYISKERYERLKEENLLDIIESIKKHSDFHLTQLKYQKKELSGQLKEISTDKNVSSSLIDSIKRELDSINIEISEIEAFIKRRNKNGKEEE